MLTIKQVKSAIKLHQLNSNWLQCSPLTQKLSQTLSLYNMRGQYDGTLNSAIDCLEQAGYEIRGRKYN